MGVARPAAACGPFVRALFVATSTRTGRTATGRKAAGRAALPKQAHRLTDSRTDGRAGVERALAWRCFGRERRCAGRKAATADAPLGAKCIRAACLCERLLADQMAEVRTERQRYNIELPLRKMQCSMLK